MATFITSPKTILYYDFITPNILDDVKKDETIIDVHVISTFIDIYDMHALGIIIQYKDIYNSRLNIVPVTLFFTRLTI